MIRVIPGLEHDPVKDTISQQESVIEFTIYGMLTSLVSRSKCLLRQLCCNSSSHSTSLSRENARSQGGYKPGGVSTTSTSIRPGSTITLIIETISAENVVHSLLCIWRWLWMMHMEMAWQHNNSHCNFFHISMKECFMIQNDILNLHQKTINILGL